MKHIITTFVRNKKIQTSLIVSGSYRVLCKKNMEKYYYLNKK